MSNEIYQNVTDKMLSMLRQGVVPWQKPWVSASGSLMIPQNFFTKKSYRGINVFILALSGYDSPYWGTFNQIRTAKGKVRKGEQGTKIIFWKRINKAVVVDDKEVEESFFLMKEWTVFNLEQTEGIEYPSITPAPVDDTTPEHVTNDAAEAIMGGYLQYGDTPNKKGPTFSEGGDRAFYVPATDAITVPKRGKYKTPEEFYTTTFHEMTHSTGHADRLNRTKWASFGSHAYGREELVAEMGAAFLSAEAGIVTTFNNSAAYLNNWMQAIQEDTKAVVIAAQNAQKAVDHILNRKPGGDTE